MKTYEIGQRGISNEQHGVVVGVFPATNGGVAYRFKSDSGAEFTVMQDEFTPE